MTTSSSSKARAIDTARHPETTAARAPGAGWLTMAAGGIGPFVLLTILLLNHTVLGFDQPLLGAARGLAVDASVWRLISESANIPLIVIGVGIVGVLLLRHRYRDAILVGALLLAVTLGSEGVKQLVARPRPLGTDPNIPGVVYSYPSGHVLEALVIFGIIALHVVRSHLPRLVAAAMVCFVVVDVAVVAVARVALAEHYPSDVLGAVLAGVGALGLYGWLTRRTRMHARD